MTASLHHSVAAGKSETEGNEVSTGFHRSDKSTAVRCWQAVVSTSGLNDKVLAADAGMSKGHYSKVSTGEQGDLLGLVYKIGEKRPELRYEFFCRLAEAEAVHPVESAAEQLAVAAIRFLRLSASLPRHTARQAKAGLASSVQKSAVNA